MESSRFIKQELLIQFLIRLPTTSFITVFFLTQEPLYMSSTTKQNSSVKLSLPLTVFTQAHIQKKSQALAQLQLQLAYLKVKNKYSLQEQLTYQASIPTWYISKSSIIKVSIGTIKRTLFTMATIQHTPTVATTVAR